jgi:hypothetical protein
MLNSDYIQGIDREPRHLDHQAHESRLSPDEVVNFYHEVLGRLTAKRRMLDKRAYTSWDTLHTYEPVLQ